jgi:hypothetical protein
MTNHRGAVVGQWDAEIAELEERLDQRLVGFPRCVLQRFPQSLVGRSSGEHRADQRVERFFAGKRASGVEHLGQQLEERRRVDPFPLLIAELDPGQARKI